MSLYERLAYQQMLAECGWTELEQQLRPLYESMTDVIPSTADPYYISLSPIDGFGVFAARDFLSDEQIGMARANGLRSPAGRYANHASQPNARMDAQGKDLVLVAAMDIAKGAEITVDYRRVLCANIEARRCN